MEGGNIRLGVMLHSQQVVNISTVIHDIWSLQEQSRAKFLNKHRVYSTYCNSKFRSYNLDQTEDKEANMCSYAT